MTGVHAQQVSRRRASGADNARPERVKVPALARAHEIDAILVSQLSRWGPTIYAAGKSASWLRRASASISTASGKPMRTIIAGLAEFERDLIRDWVKSGLAAARARGVKWAPRGAQRPSNKKAKRVLGMHADGLSYRLIAPQCWYEQEHGEGDCQVERRVMSRGDWLTVAVAAPFYLIEEVRGRRRLPVEGSARAHRQDFAVQWPDRLRGLHN